MPRFVKWSTSKRTQEFWTIQRFSDGFLIQQGTLKTGGKGPFQRFDDPEELQAAYDAEVAKKAKSKSWQRVEVPEIPTTPGTSQHYDNGLQQWQLAVIDATTLEETFVRGGTDAGGNIIKCADEVERESTAEIRIAEKLATGYVRIDGGRARVKSKFTTTGFFED